MKTRARWRVLFGVAIILSMIVGTVLAADVNIDSFTDGTFNLSRSSVGTSTQLVTGLSSAVGGYRFMILEVTVAASGQLSQWGVTSSPGFVSLSIPSLDKGKAKLQWDGNDSNTAIDCTTGLGGVDLVSTGNTGIVVRVIGSDSVAKNLIVRAYTDCSNWGLVTRAIPPVADSTYVDIPLLFSDFGSGSGTITWTSINAIELEIDGTLSSGPDATVKFIKATGETYEYGDLPLENVAGLPYGQTGFSTSILSARHVPRGMRFGGSVDTEATYPTNSPDADGDDIADIDDEDGVVPLAPGAWTAGGSGFLSISYSPCTSGCYINGWIDWNQDGDFGDSLENVIADVQKTNSSDTFIFSIPSGIFFANVRYYARFRICPAIDTCDQPDNSQTDVADGEIEDYAWDWGTPPTAVTLTSFEAKARQNAIVLKWETASEIDNLGFNVYRAEAAEGTYTKLNKSLIPSQVPPGSPVGATYTFRDRTAQSGVKYFYKLESVDIYGNSAFHGPVDALMRPPASQPNSSSGQ
jgi:hypothetical protein